MVFEYYANDLTRQLINMKASNKRLSEEHLWNMARELFSALAECQEKGFSIGGLTTNKILIDQNGHY